MKKIGIMMAMAISIIAKSQLAVVDPTVNGSIGALNAAVSGQLTSLNSQAGTISGNTTKTNVSLGQIVQRQNEIRVGLKNPALVMKFDIALRLLTLIADMKCANAKLPDLIKKTNAMNFCGFSLKFNSVSLQLNSAAQFLQLAISVAEASNAERAQNLKTAFEYFQNATFSYLSLTKMLQKQVDDNQRLNNRKKDFHNLIIRSF
jgi:hypothetical protein